MKRIFISIPYTHAEQCVIEDRVKVAEKYFITLLKMGYCPVSPIVVGHNFVTKYGADSRFEFWDAFCMSELSSCEVLHVLMIDGWSESVGVKGEIDKAIELEIPVVYVYKWSL